MHLVGDETVRLPVHCGGRLGVGRVDHAATGTSGWAFPVAVAMGSASSSAAVPSRPHLPASTPATGRALTRVIGDR